MSVTRILVFLSVVLSVTTAVHYYLWQRLVKAPLWPAPWLNVGTWLLIALGISIPLAFIAGRVLSRSAAGPLSWIAYVWMGAMFLLLVLLVPSEMVRGIGDYFLGGTNDVASPERRLFLSRGIALAVGGTGLGLSALSMVSALSPVKIENVVARLRGLPSALRGFTIVQLTDIHVGPTIGKSFIEELVRRTNALEPDVVAITGDLVDGSVAELGPLVAPLAELNARHGVFFVTGNHEYYSGVDEWVAYLGELGVRVLRNERVTIEHEGAELDIAGVDDWEAAAFGNGHGRDLPKALAGRPEGRKVVLLAHQPKQIDEASQHGVDLQLSGHTHGGQIVPFNFLVKLQQPYVAGLHQHGETTLYVSKGTGYWGPPMRLGVPAEITRVELA